MTDEFKQQSKKLELCDALCKKIANDVFKWETCMLHCDLTENDLSSLTAAGIVDKIRDILKHSTSDNNTLLFLHYLAEYPVSMCKRDVSRLLKLVIGLHYRLGSPTQEQLAEGIRKISYEDLSEIFGRSKSTISECVNQTEADWKEMQRLAELEKAAEEEAKRQLIEEKKKEIVEEKQNEGTNGKQPNEP